MDPLDGAMTCAPKPLALPEDEHPWAVAMTDALAWAKNSRKRPREDEPGPAGDGHYDLLQVSRSASGAEIRSAYRRGALLTHPDKGGNPEEFKKVVAAFEVLSDQLRRKEYDRQLQKQQSRDGLSAQTPAEAGEEAPSGRKLVLGRARLLMLQLLEEIGWQEKLQAAPREVLEALLSQLTRRKAAEPDARAEEGAVSRAPREVDPPEGLPPGWTCFEYTYKSGLLKGKKYLRFNSPWGQQGILSVKAAIRAHAEHSGLDGLAAARTWDARRFSAAPAAATAGGDGDGEVPREPQSERVRTQQRSIYAAKASNGIVRYFVQLSYSSFIIRTGRTLQLAEAIDWHIALTQTVATASARLRRKGGNPLPPLEQSELRQLLQAEPSIQLSFRSAFSSKHGTIYSPTTRGLDLAVQQYHALRALVRSRPSRDRLAACRKKAADEACAHQKARQGLERQLQKAVQVELQSRACGRLGPVEGPSPALQAPPVEASQDAAAALELKGALGLTCAAARRLAAQLRCLPKAELRRRVKVLQHAKSPKTSSPARPAAAAGAIAAIGTSQTIVPAPGARPAPAGTLFGLPCADVGVALLASLSFEELFSLNGMCKAAKALVSYETWRRLRDFSYHPSLFEPKTKASRRGRVLPANKDIVAQRFLHFLRQNAWCVERLDLQQCGGRVLESPQLRAALRDMPRLQQLVLPCHGWSSPTERQRLLWHLAEQVQVMLPGRAAPKCQVGAEALVGLSQLVEGWQNFSEKGKQEVHSLLRKEVAQGRLAPRNSAKWQWGADDPALQHVRALLESIL
ncbi:unnamed protein product [Effrenium voratum]|uniref:J domain-containing protein n=1 Tax=Effrenium voratum TaxID=2562239 RepID=A0AA36HUT5_9DINO|nr:unnamed protein product [Effrenium voratum]